MVGDEIEGKWMLESHQVLPVHNSKVDIAVCAKRVRTTPMVIFETGAGSNSIREDFVMTAWTTLLRMVKTSRLLSVSERSMEFEGLISRHLQMELLHDKVAFLVASRLARNMLLDKVFNSAYTEKLIPKAETISPVNLSAVAIAEAAEESPATPVENGRSPEPVEAPCVIARSVK